MSNVMLINPSSREILENAGDRPPLGLLYLGAILRRRGHKVRVMDMDHHNHYDLVSEVERNPPDYAGVSVYTSPIFKQAIEIAEFLKGKCKTIAGGYHATALPYSVLPFFDAVIMGEGEIALPKIIENKLEGLVHGEKMDIEKIPRPARFLVDIKAYKFKQDGRPATTLLSSRGCTNNCVYCGNMNRQMRFHTDRQVIREVRQLKRYGFHNLYFYDDTFTANKIRAIELVNKLKDENIHYRITTRANNLDEELVKALADSGCTWVSLGIESGNDDRLRDIKKHMTTSDNLKAVRLLNKYGIKTKGFFMFGLPNESLEDANETIYFAKELKKQGLTTADFYIMTPFPGTQIWIHPEMYGITILDRDYTKYLEVGKTSTKAFHRTKYMSARDIEEVRNRAEEVWKKAG